MAVEQVYIPEKVDKFGRFVNMASTGANMYGAGKTFGWWGGGAEGATTGGTVGANAGQGMGLGVTPMKPIITGSASDYAGSSYAAPEISTPAATGSGQATSGESILGAAGPIAIGAAGMGFGAMAEGDYINKGEKSGNAPYSTRGQGPNIKVDPKDTWGGDSISRRLSAKNMEPMNPFNFTELRKTIEVMPLSDVDKSNFFGKLTQIKNLSNLFKTNKA